MKLPASIILWIIIQKLYIVDKDLETPFSKSLEDMKATEKEDTSENK